PDECSVKYVTATKYTEWPIILNGLLPSLTAQYVLTLLAGDVLAPHGLLQLGRRAMELPAVAAWYTDTDTLSRHRGPSDTPLLKPDFNLDLLRSYPYVGQNIAFHIPTILELGGLAEDLNESTFTDLIFRIVEHKGPPAIGHLSEVLIHTSYHPLQWAAEATVQTAHCQAIQRHLERIGLESARISASTSGPLLEIEYPQDRKSVV